MMFPTSCLDRRGETGDAGKESWRTLANSNSWGDGYAERRSVELRSGACAGVVSLSCGLLILRHGWVSLIGSDDTDMWPHREKR